MNPHQQNKVDISSLTPEEQRLLRLYGKMPNKKDLLQNKLKERKYFDSGDYALSKAGKASDVGVTNIGSQHPVPENIPHLTATSPGANNPAAAGNNGSAANQGQQVPGNSISGHPGSIGFPGSSSAKEGSYLQQETNAEDSEGAADSAANEKQQPEDASTSPPPAREGVPIQQ